MLLTIEKYKVNTETTTILLHCYYWFYILRVVLVKSGLPLTASAACINFLVPSSEKVLKLTLQWKRKQKCNYDAEVVQKSYQQLC